MTNNLDICKARNLFVKRGILNRNILSDNIIYSWVRSKLHNISFEILDRPTEKKSIDLLAIDKKTSTLINYIRNINISCSNIYLINLDGNLIYKSEQNTLKLPDFTNFREEAIGTSAFGISLAIGENMKVFGCEHYNVSLVNYVSETIVIEGDKEFDGVIVGIFSKTVDYTAHSELFKQILLDNTKVEEIPINNDETKEESIEKTPVNPVKKVLNTGKKPNSSISLNASYSKECKVFTLSIVEKEIIIEALEYFSWNMKKSAEALGIGRSTLYRKIKEYSIEK